MNKKLKWLLILIICVFVPTSLATLSPSDKTKNKSKEIKVKTEPADKNVFDRNLIQKEPAAKDILVENAAYYKDTSLKSFNGTVLGYVTPWNGRGYDVAKTFKSKWDILSPVWLQLVPKGDNQYALEGMHDIDEPWLREIQLADIKVMPRVIFDKFTEKDARGLLSNMDNYYTVAKILSTACTRNRFEGFVLEFWSQFAPISPREEIMILIMKIGDALKQVGCKTVLVIPPKRPSLENLFTQKHFKWLHGSVDYFSLMTYDFSSYHRPGANAPLYWIKESIEHIVPENFEDFTKNRAKILMGLNMYGRDYTPEGGRAILGEDFLQLLKQYKKKLIHDERDEENFFELRKKNTRNTVFYPTLYSINERIKLAREMGVGLAIWELGQGLMYFYDLF